MSTQKLLSDQKDQAQKMGKLLSVLFTIIYALLFPLFFVISLFGAFLFAIPPKPDQELELFLIYTTFISFWLVPISFLISITLMWWKYHRRQYKKIAVICTIPIFIFIWASLSMLVLDLLTRPAIH